MIRHSFVAIDEGRATLLCVDEQAPARDWVVPIGHPAARDLQLIGDGRLLVGHHHGWSEFDLATGRTLFTCAAYEGVTAVRRQPNGHTLLAGVDLAGEKGVAVLELDAHQRLVRRVRYEGDYVRLIRQTAADTYLMSCNDRIREGAPDGGYLREFPVAGFYHAWKAVRFPEGHTLVSAGYGAFMVELDAAGAVVRTFGGKDQVPAAVNPFFYAMFQVLPNRHVVVANWQGHGEGLGGQGVQLLEFDPAGTIVWQWSEAARISSLQGVLVLDGLDVAQLHDERAGRMEALGKPR
jgi:hypothetical protein